MSHIAGSGYLSLVMGHRRLSVIDPSPNGHQPFCIASKVLCFNGEIYNYLELRAELQKLGVKFTTETDTEVFLHAYIFWGEKAFKKFNGMWGAAIYDTESEELLLVRDQFGIKPLYYLSNDNGFFFGSEIKYFKRLEVLGSFNESAIYQYLRYAETDYDETTFFDNLFQVTPGKYLKVSRSGISTGSYWSEDALKNVGQSRGPLIESLRAAIGIPRSDVPVGSLPSGGLDSSLIVGVISELKGLDGFEAYSADFSDEAYSEKNMLTLMLGFWVLLLIIYSRQWPI